MAFYHSIYSFHSLKGSQLLGLGRKEGLEIERKGLLIGVFG